MQMWLSQTLGALPTKRAAEIVILSMYNLVSRLSDRRLPQHYTEVRSLLCVAEGFESPKDARSAEDASAVIDHHRAAVVDIQRIHRGCKLALGGQHVRQVCAVVRYSVHIKVLCPRNATLSEFCFGIPTCTGSAEAVREPVQNLLV